LVIQANNSGNQQASKYCEQNHCPGRRRSRNFPAGAANKTKTASADQPLSIAFPSTQSQAIERSQRHVTAEVPLSGSFSLISPLKLLAELLPLSRSILLVFISTRFFPKYMNLEI